MSDANETAAAPAAAPAKKKSKLLLIIIAFVVLLAAGGGAYFFLFKGSAASAKEKKSSAKKVSDAEDEADSHEEPAEAESGRDSEAKTEDAGKKSSKSVKVSLPKDEDVKAVIELQPFIVNLADTEEARYLRLTVSLGLAGEGGEEKPDSIFTTRVRNALLAVLTTKRSDDILSAEGKDRLRKELLTAARAASKEPQVEAIYITDFIVQL